MKLSDIVFPLSPAESGGLYSRLAFLGARAFTTRSNQMWKTLSDEEMLAVAAQQSRFDYRLLYILVALMAEHFRSFHPFRLREAATEIRDPAVWGVVFEYARKLCPDVDLLAFSEIVLRNIPASPEQMFFNSLRTPRPEAMMLVMQRTPDEFRKWGFFCEETPILKELEPIRSPKTFSKVSRKKILQRLFFDKGEIRMSDYLSAIDHAVSRQQAYKDLVGFRGVRAISDRRGRRYSLIRHEV